MFALIQSAQLHLLNPNLSLPLLLTGIFLLYLEFNIPGRVLPAAIGMFAIALALNALRLAPILPLALALALACALMIPATLWLPRPLPLKPAFLQANTLPIILTLLLAYALFRLTDVPAARSHVHPLVAFGCAVAFSFVTLKLGSIAVLARHNKRIR